MSCIFSQMTLQGLPKNSNQYWFRLQFGIIRKQAIILAYVDQDLCCHMASVGGIKLMILDWSDNSYHQVSNISRTPVDNKIVDHSNVVGASPVGAAPTTSSFST